MTLYNVADLTADDEPQDSVAPPPQKKVYKLDELTPDTAAQTDAPKPKPVYKLSELQADTPAPKEPVKLADVQPDTGPAPTVAVGAPKRPVVNAPTDSFDTRKYLPKDKSVKPIAAPAPVAPNPNAALIDSLNNQNPLATGHEVSSVTNKPTQSLVERAGGQAKFDAANQQFAHQQAIHDKTFQTALNASPEQKTAAIKELAKLGPINESEQQQLGITGHYLQSLVDPLFARSEELAAGVARIGGKIGIPGAQSGYEYLKNAAEEDRLRGNTIGARGHVGDILGTAGELIPDLSLARVLPGGLASEAYWPAVGAVGAAGRGGNAEDIVKAGLANVTPIAGARLFAGAPLLGRVVANVVLNETTSGMSGGAKDLHSILTNGIMATAMGWHGKPGTVEELQAQTTPEDIARAEKIGNDTNVVRAAQEFATTRSPESEAALQKAMVNAGMPVDQAVAVINDTKSASEATTGRLPAPQGSTTTPESLKSTEVPRASDLRENQTGISEQGQVGQAGEVNRSGNDQQVRVGEGQSDAATRRSGGPQEEGQIAFTEPVHEDGVTIEHGKPVTLGYIRNTERAPQMGSEYQQDIEPTGRYMSHDEDASRSLSPGWERGTVTFKNPLVIEANTNPEGARYDENGWKARLSEQYGGKTGQELTDAIKADGHDGIVTVEPFRGKMTTSEIVDLTDKPEVKPNEQPTQNNPVAPDFDHEVKTVSDALNDDNHPLSVALDRVAGGDTSDEAINAVRTAGKDFDESSINDLIDGATRLAKKQPTENPEPLPRDGPTAQESVGQPDQTVEPPKPPPPPGFEPTGKQPPKPPPPPGFEPTGKQPPINENRHWNFRRSQFSGPESEANFRDLIKKTVAENGEAHKTRVTQKEFVARANEIDPELAKEAIKNYKPGDPVPSREIFHAAAEYAQNNIREAGEIRQMIKDGEDTLSPAQRQKLETEADRLEHDAKEAIGGAIGVRSEFGRSLALLATTKMDVDSPANMIRRADAAAKARGDDLTSKNWQIQRKQTMDQAVRLEQAKMRENDLLKQLSEAPKGKRKSVNEDVSLSTFVRKRGGFKSDKDLQGEINRFRSKESGTTGLFSKKGLSPDYMREAAVEAGYLPEDATIDDLMEKLQQDMSGKKVYSTQRDQGLYDKELTAQYKKANPEEFQTWQQRFTGKLDKLEQEARARLSETWNPNALNSVEVLIGRSADLAIILASKIAKKLVSLTEIRKEMIDEFGIHFTQDQDRIEKAALEIHNDQRLEALTEAAKVPNKEVRKSALAELKGEVSKREQAAKTEQAKADKAVKDSQATEAKAATKQAKLDEAAKQKQVAADARDSAKKARQAQREAEVNEQKGIRQEAVNAKKAAAQEANPVYQLKVQGKATELRLNQPGEVATVDDLSKIGAAKLHEPGMTPSRWTAEMQKFGKSFTENQREIRDGAAKLSADAKDQVKAQQDAKTAAASYAYRLAIKQGRTEAEAKTAARNARDTAGQHTQEQIDQLKELYNQARTERMAAQRNLAKSFSNLEETTLEKASNAIKIGLISGARTLGKIIASHGSYAGMEAAAKIPASVADMIQSALNGNERQAGGLSLDMLKSAARAGIKRGIPDAMTKLKTGYFPEGEDIYSRAQGASNPLEAREIHFNSNSKVLDAYSKVLNGIMRVHGAVYSVHRVAMVDMALKEQSALVAKTEAKAALKAGKIQRSDAADYARMRAEDLYKNPPETLAATAIGAAEESSFVNENLTNQFIKGAKNMAGKVPGVGPVLKFGIDRLAPYSKVPANVAARTIEGFGPVSIPYAFLRLGLRALQEKGYTPEMQAQFSKTIGRGTVGSLGPVLLGYALASQGYQTGFIQDYDKKGSTRILGRQWRTSAIPPFGTLMALGASIYELQHSPVSTSTPAGKKVFLKELGGAAMDTVAEQPMVHELHTFDELSSAKDLGHAANKFAGGFAGQVVPTIVSDTAAQIDRTKRQKDSIMDYVHERIPFWRSTLPASKYPGLEPNKLFDPFSSIPAPPKTETDRPSLRPFLPRHK